MADDTTTKEPVVEDAPTTDAEDAKDADVDDDAKKDSSDE